MYPFYLCLLRFSSRPPAPSLSSHPHYLLLPRLILNPSFCPCLHPHPHGSLCLPVCHPYLSQNIHLMLWALHPLGCCPSLSQNLQISACLTPLSSPFPYFMLLSPRCIILTSFNFSSSFALRCVC